MRNSLSRPLRILMVSSEVESLARTGGLGDVVEALSLSLAERGAEVVVVTPLYGVTRVPSETTRWGETVAARWGWGPGDVRSVSVVEAVPTRFASGGSRRICLLDDPGLYGRQGLYGDAAGAFGDNALRFAVMSRAALELSTRIWSDGPDIVHAHDWHAAFAIVYAKCVMGERWARTRAVFTVHNLQFQGVLDESALDQLHLPREAFRPEILWHEGNVNLMKGATALADAITTVSPTYAKEILTPEGGFGLDLHLRAHAARLVGITNGIDTSAWDPSRDDALATRYDAGMLDRRRACRDALAVELGLAPTDGPIVATVSRLSWQKGIDLFLPLADELLAAGARIVVVGQGDRPIEEHLQHLASIYPGRFVVRIAFDPALSRRVYAGADFFVVPSRFEPCGLTQMYAMRYGAIPVVTDVGGLHDTVHPVAGDAGTGFLAARADVGALRDAFRGAFALFANRPRMDAAIRRGMAEDFAWTTSAGRYVALFERLRGTTPEHREAVNAGDAGLARGIR